jgi:hypothetical protein
LDLPLNPAKDLKFLTARALANERRGRPDERRIDQVKTPKFSQNPVDFTRFFDNFTPPLIGI